MQDQLLFFFSALGGFNALLLSGYFAVEARNKNKSNYFLSTLLFVLSLRITKSVFFYFNPQLANIYIQTGLSACLLIGPFLFLYLKSSVEETQRNWAFHIFPYFITITIAGTIYPYVENRKIWEWIVWTIYGQWLVYIIVSYKYIHPIFQKLIRNNILNKVDIWLLSIYLGVAMIWASYYTSNYTSYIVGALSFSFILYLIVLLLILKNNNDPAFFKEKEKYKNKFIPTDIQQQIELKLSLIADNELFTNPNFTLEDAAKELKVTKHMLSQYLNEKLGKSFSSLINEYRIEKAKKLLQSEKNYTVENIGYDSGFNSKSTFFTTFKKITGQTPAEYQKNLIK